MLRWYNDISIRNKIVGAFATLIVINLAVALAIIYSNQKLSGSIKTNNEASQAVTSLNNYHSQMNEVHNQMLNLLLSGDIKYIDLYREESANAVSMSDKTLTHITQADASLTPVMNELNSLFMQWKESIAEPQISNMNNPYTVDIARLLENSPENKALWAKIDKDIGLLIQKLTTVQTARAEEQASVLSQVDMLSIGGSLLLMALSIFIAIILTKFVGQPLLQLANATNSLKDRDWDTQIDHTERGDELGQMAKALEIFRTNGIEQEQLQAEQRQQDAAKVQRAQQIEEAVNHFDKIVQDLLLTLGSASENMGGSAANLNQLADKTAENASNVTQSVRVAGSNVQSVAAAVEELSAAVNEISSQMQRTRGITGNTTSSANAAVKKVKSLEESTQKISNIVEIITAIAGQTNLLALNATIESARAGEAGKGFAVVANEVKGLANQTSSATNEITQMIELIQQETRDVVVAINEIAEAISELDQTTVTTAASVEEQSVATDEIASNVANVSNETNTVVEIIEGVHQDAQETQNIAGSVDAMARELTQSNRALSEEVQSFLQKIKSA
ncbi:MAG: hypothetical protein CMM94_02235 [Rickettsiales bacterium]|nr:hypothetical protein [Rickettsiales bacterium]